MLICQAAETKRNHRELKHSVRQSCQSPARIEKQKASRNQKQVLSTLHRKRCKISNKQTNKPFLQCIYYEIQGRGNDISPHTPCPVVCEGGTTRFGDGLRGPHPQHVSNLTNPYVINTRKKKYNKIICNVPTCRFNDLLSGNSHCTCAILDYSFFFKSWEKQTDIFSQTWDL